MGKVVKSITKPIKSVIGSVTGSSGAGAAKDAAKIQANAATEAARLQHEQYLRQEALQAPFRQAGLDAQNRLLQYMGLGGSTSSPNYGKYTGDFSMEDFQQDPGYSFRLNEGLKSLDRQAAARGGLISGGALKAAQRYGQDMASQEYQNAFNRYQVNRSNQLNPLQSLMGSGQTSTNQLGNYGANYAAQAGDAIQNAAAARASGYVGAANARAGGVNNLLTLGTNVLPFLGL